MGGNAFIKFGITTKRINKHTYDHIKHNIVSQLKQYIVCDVVPELYEKTTFGDLDILYITNNEDITILIKKLFNPKYIVSTNVISFSFEYQKDEYFQIDLVKAKDKNDFDLKYFYYSFGDIGNIIGHISNYYGLKYGSEGVFINTSKKAMIKLFPENKDIDTFINDEHIHIPISGNVDQICEILKLNKTFLTETIKNATNIQIYEYIKSLPLFHYAIFENLNHDHYERMLKRPFFTSFIDYINVKPVKGAHTYCDNKYDIQAEIITQFHKKDLLMNEISRIILSKKEKIKFNGKHIMDTYKNVFGKNIDPKNINNVKEEFKKYVVGLYGLTFENYLDKCNFVENDLVAFFTEKN